MVKLPPFALAHEPTIVAWWGSPHPSIMRISANYLTYSRLGDMFYIEKNIFSLPVVYFSYTGHFGAVKPGRLPFDEVRRTIRKAKENL
jgi:hypothetical protein